MYVKYVNRYSGTVSKINLKMKITGQLWKLSSKAALKENIFIIYFKSVQINNGVKLINQL